MRLSFSWSVLGWKLKRRALGSMSVDASITLRPERGKSEAIMLESSCIVTEHWRKQMLLHWRKLRRFCCPTLVILVEEDDGYRSWPYHPPGRCLNIVFVPWEGNGSTRDDLIDWKNQEDDSNHNRWILDTDTCTECVQHDGLSLRQSWSISIEV